MIDPICRDIIVALGITRFVETGTDKGETIGLVSSWFSQLDPAFGRITGWDKSAARSYAAGSEAIAYPVFGEVGHSRFQIHSVDVDAASYQSARQRFETNRNIQLHQQSSEQFLKKLLSQDYVGHTLFFLDAHWGKYWPLRDEIKVINQLSRFVVIIDDFFVPGKSRPEFPHGDFGFDIYGRTILDWSYVRDAFGDQPPRIFYPQTANRDRRGWVLLTRGYSTGQLEFLNTLNLREVPFNDPAHQDVVKPTWKTFCDGRNILKLLFPLNWLRQGHRGYEKIRFAWDAFLTQQKQQNKTREGS